MKGARKNAQGIITEPGNMGNLCCGLSGNYGSSTALFPRFRARPSRPDTGRSRRRRIDRDAGGSQRIKRQKKTRTVYRFVHGPTEVYPCPSSSSGRVPRMAVEKVKSGELRAHSKKPLLSRSSPGTVQQLSPKLALRVLLNKAQIRMKLRCIGQN